MQINQDNLDWLLENAGPIIRYRTALELLGESDEKKVELLKKGLLSDSLVQLWLGNLRRYFGRNEMRHSKSEAFENVMGELYEFGLRKGARALDERTDPFRRWLAKQTSLPKEGRFRPVFYQTLAATFLSMTGYSDEDAVHTWILKRLETTYPFAKKGDLDDVYVPQDSFLSFVHLNLTMSYTNKGSNRASKIRECELWV